MVDFCRIFTLELKSVSCVKPKVNIYLLHLTSVLNVDVGSVPSWGRAFLYGACMFFLSLHGFPLGAPASFPQSRDMHVRLVRDSKYKSKCKCVACLSL